MYKMILRPYETGEWWISASLDEDADDDSQGDHPQPERHQYRAIHQAFCPRARVLPWEEDHSTKHVKETLLEDHKELLNKEMRGPPGDHGQDYKKTACNEGGGKDSVGSFCIKHTIQFQICISNRPFNIYQIEKLVSLASEFRHLFTAGFYTVLDVCPKIDSSKDFSSTCCGQEKPKDQEHCRSRAGDLNNNGDFCIRIRWIAFFGGYMNAKQSDLPLLHVENPVVGTAVPPQWLHCALLLLHPDVHPQLLLTHRHGLDGSAGGWKG